MTQPIETIMHQAVGRLYRSGYTMTSVRLPATAAYDMDPATAMFTIPKPVGAGSFPGADRIELLKDGEVAVTITENMVRLWGDDDQTLAARITDLMEIIG